MTIPADIREKAEAMVNQAGPGGDDRPTLVANIIALVMEQREQGRDVTATENAAKGLYPDDILRAAESVFLTEIRIAHVLMAERERCAQIAERYEAGPSSFYDGHEQSACLYGQEAAAGAIASAIRNEGEQKT